MYVRLTRKPAEYLNGVNVSRYEVGHQIEVTKEQAAMLIAEGWAERVAEGGPPTSAVTTP
jgi:hypothetical protein